MSPPPSEAVIAAAPESQNTQVRNMLRRHDLRRRVETLERRRGALDAMAADASEERAVG